MTHAEEEKSYKLWLSTPISAPLTQPPFLAISSIDLGTPEGDDIGSRVITVVYDSEDSTVRGFEACKRMVRVGFNGDLAVYSLEEEELTDPDDLFVTYGFEGTPSLEEEVDMSDDDIRALVDILAGLPEKEWD